jgi:pyruvate kinase
MQLDSNLVSEPESNCIKLGMPNRNFAKVLLGADRMIKTKIIATLGPSSDQVETIQVLMDQGVDVFRLNFSHGTFAGHTQLLHNINEVRATHRHVAAVVGDVCGPKIRTSRIEPEGEEVRDEEEVIIIAGDKPGTVHRFGTNYEHFVNDIQVGQRILIDDGQIALKAIQKDAETVTCSVLFGGVIRSRKGINLPDTQVSIPSITDYDWQCIDWAIEHQLEYLALSFVRQAEEILQVKEYLRKANSDIKVISKIEKPEAIENLQSIVEASDAVLVARGDLGVEMDLAQVPLIQKRITSLCRQVGKPVVVATQMLQSMIENPTPTRAEVNDVANAIMDYTDAVMLSGETAVGKYPIKAIQTIRRIAQHTEAYLDQNDAPRPKIEAGEYLAFASAVARSVAQIVDDTDAKLVAVWSQTGSMAQFLSKARIDVPILAMSSNQRICGQMALHYGVIGRHHPVPQGIAEFTRDLDRMIIEHHWVESGDQIVLVAGPPLGAAGTINTILIHTVTGD